MNSIKTTLTTSGNSVAVRLPKELLRLSGLGHNVQLDVKKGKITISNIAGARQGWSAQIKELVNTEGQPSAEFTDMNVSNNDGLADLPWDGLTYNEWKKK